MYDLLTGPLALLALLVFFVGLIVRTVIYVRGLDWQLDRVTYSVNTSYGVKGAIKSIFFWILPFGSRSWRMNPVFTILVFLFHIGLLFTPIFLLAHNMILKDKLGIQFFTISDATADIMTLTVIITGFLLLLRRIALPEVRIITNTYDYFLLAVTVAPFISGFLAFHHIGNYDFWLYTHIISGIVWLVAVPFTKLSHIILFFCSRAQIGMDFGIKRGGMKGSGITY